MFLGGLFAENPRVEPAASYAILTTRPGALLARLHDREPVRIPVPLLERWLDPGVRDAASLSDFLEPGDPGDLEAVPVSKAVNRVGVDEPSLLEPVGTPLQVSC